MEQRPPSSSNPSKEPLSAPAATILAQPLHPKIRALVEYWVSIHPASGLPGRQHFEPLDIAELLPNIWLVDVERSPTLRFRYRLIGTSVARAFEHEPTGRYLDDAHADAHDGRIRLSVSDVVRDRQPNWRTGRPTLWHLQDYLQLERVFLPMASDGETIDLILALTVFLDRFGVEF